MHCANGHVSNPCCKCLIKTRFLITGERTSRKFQFVTGTCDQNITLTFNHETAEAHKRRLTATETHCGRQ